MPFLIFRKSAEYANITARNMPYIKAFVIGGTSGMTENVSEPCPQFDNRCGPNQNCVAYTAQLLPRFIAYRELHAEVEIGVPQMTQ